MAVSTVLSLDNILKEFYSGPIRDQLNNEMLVFELFNRRKMSWTGRKVIMPVRVARNGSGQFVSDNGNLPGADEQTYKDLNIKSKYLYGRMSISGPAIAQAKASAGAFVNGLQQELDGAVETVKNTADKACFTGGGVIGFVNDKAAAASTMQFSGNLGQAPAVGGTPIPVVMVQTDTYARLPLNGGAGSQVHVIQSALAGNIDFVTAAGAVNTVDLTGLANGAVASIVLATVDDAGLIPTGDQALGIYGNLAAGYYDAGVAVTQLPHFAVDRSTLSGSPILQATVECVDNTGTGVRSPLSTQRMQSMLDSIAQESGVTPDCMIASYIFRQEYTSLMSFTSLTNLSTSLNKSVDSGDAGFNVGGLSFNGIPLKVARQCGKGLLIFLNLKSWLVTEVEAPGLADMDGNVLNREPGKDAYEAFVRYYYNTVCTAPNRNGILVGINYAGV